ncbi:MAG: FAD:protein FMN transferase [bacterium]
MKKYYNFLILLLFFIVSSCTNKDEVIKRKTFTMGTIMEIQVSGVSKEVADKAITKAISEIEKLNTLYSTYKEDNYIWELNHSDSDTIKVFPETYKFLQYCDTAYKLTDGNFDAAIGNFIELLGFEKDKPDVPSEEAVKNVLKKVGWKHIKLLPDDQLYKPKDIKLSFNAFLPGYAADLAGQILESYGITEYLINAGGEIYGVGKDWMVGIQHPRKKDTLMGSIVINGWGVATSGDYERYFKKNGKRYSHIINPLTGYPVQGCEAVTIIAETAVMADYLSTGVFAAGPEKGMEIIEKLPDVEGIIVDTSGVVRQSLGFKKFFRR